MVIFHDEFWDINLSMHFKNNPLCKFGAKSTNWQMSDGGKNIFEQPVICDVLH